MPTEESAGERFDNTGQFIGSPPVVAVEERDDFAAHCGTPK